MHLADRTFDEYGGPMLFTITPTSLKNYAEYLDRVKAMGHKSFSVVTRMRFDPNVKFQKIVFSPYRALSNEEFEISKEMRKDPRTMRVLDEEPEVGSVATEEYDTETGEITPIATKPAPKPAMKQEAKPAASTVSPKFKPVATQEAAPATTAKAPPPPRPGGFPATPQTVAAAMTKPATRPATVRPIVQPPVEEEQVEEDEVLDDEIVDSLNDELDNDLKRLLSGD